MEQEYGTRSPTISEEANAPGIGKEFVVGAIGGIIQVIIGM
jgi:hypothetical protein